MWTPYCLHSSHSSCQIHLIYSEERRHHSNMARQAEGSPISQASLPWQHVLQWSSSTEELPASRCETIILESEKSNCFRFDKHYSIFGVSFREHSVSKRSCMCWWMLCSDCVFVCICSVQRILLLLVFTQWRRSSFAACVYLWSGQKQTGFLSLCKWSIYWI